MEDLKKLTIKELRQKAQDSAPEAGHDPYIGLTIRFFSIYITYFLIRTKITPNQVTAISVLVFFTGISMFIFKSQLHYLLGIFLIYISIVLDGCDGEVARLKGTKKFVGSTYTESISHDIQYGLMFIPLTISAYFTTGSVIIIYVGFVATIAKLLYRFLITRYSLLLLKRRLAKDSDFIRNEKSALPFNEDVNFFHKIYRFINRNIFSNVGFICPLLILLLFDRIDLFIWVFAIFFTIITIIVFFKQVIYISRLED